MSLKYCKQKNGMPFIVYVVIDYFLLHLVKEVDNIKSQEWIESRCMGVNKEGLGGRSLSPQFLATIKKYH